MTYDIRTSGSVKLPRRVASFSPSVLGSDRTYYARGPFIMEADYPENVGRNLRLNLVFLKGLIGAGCAAGQSAR